jgi:hypothetical protein
VCHQMGITPVIVPKVILKGAACHSTRSVLILKWLRHDR